MRGMRCDTRTPLPILVGLNEPQILGDKGGSGCIPLAPSPTTPKHRWGWGTHGSATTPSQSLNLQKGGGNTKKILSVAPLSS